VLFLKTARSFSGMIFLIFFSAFLLHPIFILWDAGLNEYREKHGSTDETQDPTDETQGPTDEEAKKNGFGIDAEQLSNLVKNKDFEALDDHGGIDNLFDKLKTSQEQGLQTCEERDLEIRRDIFSTNTYIEKPPKGFWSFVWDATHDLTLIILAVCAVVSLAIGIITEGWQEGQFSLKY
jgi:Ca2+-transporting ATPase